MGFGNIGKKNLQLHLREHRSSLFVDDGVSLEDVPPCDDGVDVLLSEKSVMNYILFHTGLACK
jgi:hypothetical protein